MEKQEVQSIPYIAFESVQARNEKDKMRLWATIVILIVSILATNIAWLMYINEYDFESYSVSTEGGGNANYIGNDGDIYNGTSKNCQENEEEP